MPVAAFVQVMFKLLIQRDAAMRLFVDKMFPGFGNTKSFF